MGRLKLFLEGAFRRIANPAGRPLSGCKPDDSVHYPKALPLGWDMTGFQP
ncbi:MAG: hypothetical protein LBT78_06650 [Tannerella sp.]|nr:hypothetical protein [Tannerella sp.]